MTWDSVEREERGDGGAESGGEVYPWFVLRAERKGCLRRLCIIHCFGCITCVEEDACHPLLWLHRFSSLSLSQPPPHLLLFYRHRILLHSAPFPFLPPPPMAAPNGVRFRCFVPEGHTGGDFLYVNFCLLFFFNRILYCTRTPHGRRLSFL